MGSESTPWRDATLASQPLNAVRGLQSLYNRPQLEAVLHRERARADRNRMEFSLVLFRSRGEEFRATVRLARMLLKRSRGTDELGWFDSTCIAVLLPYTSADGARAFAENALREAQEELVPAICRIYTYPSAWYFDDDVKPGHRASHAIGKDHGGNGNGHGSGGGNGHGGTGNGDGNGHANGNGDVHANGNGDDHGNGHAHDGIGGVSAMTGALSVTATGSAVATETESSVDAAELIAAIECPDRQPISATSPAPEARSRRDFQPNDLVPYLMQGVTDGLKSPEAGPDGVTTLLVKRLPWWKRGLDVAGASAGLVLLSPVMILSALLIKGTSRGPVIFKQRRAGLGGQPFWIYKFRTMSNDAEARKAALRAQSEQDGPAFKLADDPRVTPVGRVLRETSLDELPQLWNVIKGDMSLVGPRPLPMDESAECQQWQRRRLDVTPGLTCIWQVKGRSRVTFVEWMRMDVEYIRRRNLWHDVKILAQTIPAVLLRRGAK